MILIWCTNAYTNAPISILTKRSRNNDVVADQVLPPDQQPVADPNIVAEPKPSSSTNDIKKTANVVKKQVVKKPIKKVAKPVKKSTNSVNKSTNDKVVVITPIVNTQKQIGTINVPKAISSIEKPEIVQLELEENKNNTFLTFVCKDGFKTAAFVKNGKLMIFFNRPLSKLIYTSSML